MKWPRWKRPSGANNIQSRSRSPSPSRLNTPLDPDLYRAADPCAALDINVIPPGAAGRIDRLDYIDWSHKMGHSDAHDDQDQGHAYH